MVGWVDYVHSFIYSDDRLDRSQICSLQLPLHTFWILDDAGRAVLLHDVSDRPYTLSTSEDGVGSLQLAAT